MYFVYSLLLERTNSLEVVTSSVVITSSVPRYACFRWKRTKLIAVQQAMEEIHKLRAQISSIVRTNFPDLDAGFVANLTPPTSLQVPEAPTTYEG